MSYFIAISGAAAAGLKVEQGQLVPASATQPYFAALAEALEILDGGSCYLWDDAETGSSEELVCAAEISIANGHSLESTAFGDVLGACARRGASFRVWWAGQLGPPFDQVPVVHSVVKARKLIENFLRADEFIGFALQHAPRSTLNRRASGSSSQR